MRQKRWIKSPTELDGAALSFVKTFSVTGEVKSAKVHVSAVGTYQAKINGQKIGRQVLTPGFTSYQNRVQYQTVDVTDAIAAENRITVTVAPGWAVGNMGYGGMQKVYADHLRAACEIELEMADGSVSCVGADESWQVFTDEVT